MELKQFKDFLPLVTGFLGGATSSGVFAGPIKTLQDWWYINYGHDISSQAALLRAKNEIDVENLKNSTLQQVATIPPENIQEPSLKILGPALEASRYYIEEEELRSMFAKILSGSLDNRKNKILHPSFVEIVKQLDVTDANVLKHLKTKNYHESYPIPTMRMIIKKEQGYNVVLPIIYFITGTEGLDKFSASLTNLERLGLVNLNTDIWNSNDNDYEVIRNNQDVKNILALYPECTLEKTSFTITPLGKNFLKVCL